MTNLQFRVVWRKTNAVEFDSRIVSSSTFSITRRAHVGCHKLDIFGTHANTRRMEPVFARLATDVQSAIYQSHITSFLLTSSPNHFFKLYESKSFSSSLPRQHCSSWHWKLQILKKFLSFNNEWINRSVHAEPRTQMQNHPYTHTRTHHHISVSRPTETVIEVIRLLKFIQLTDSRRTDKKMIRVHQNRIQLELN